MRGLLRKEWLGWLSFTSAGKLAAVLMLVLLLMWALKLGHGTQKKLWLYTLVMTVLCSFPVTAACLMLYQTKFYDYEWIWNLVPMTAMIAAAGCLLMDKVWEDKACTARLQEDKADGDASRRIRSLSRREKGLLAAGAVGVLLLCGRLGNPEWTVQDLGERRKEIARVLSVVKEGAQEEICLWAPREVMEQARSLDGDITLVYGRNMWQAHMNAFSYDSYTPEVTRLFLWMEMAPIYGSLQVPAEDGRAAVPEMAPPKGELIDGLECVEIAKAQGVNRILLPGTMSPEAVEAFEDYLHTKADRAGDYYLLRIAP